MKIIKYLEGNCAVWMIVFLLFIAGAVKGQPPTVRINEFMAYNQTTLADEDGDYSDWIEIYNPTSAAVNLWGWALSDDPGVPHQWMFPDIKIEANSYLLVFASGKNRAVPGSELHANFKLNGSGEYLVLMNNVNVAVSEFTPSFPLQLDDVSYGYYDGTYISFNEPTPGADNQLSGSLLLLPPEFNMDHGFHETAFELEISSDVDGADIYYTTDGSIPATDNGILYSGPVNIDVTTVIRVAAALEGDFGKIATCTYCSLMISLISPMIWKDTQL